MLLETIIFFTIFFLIQGILNFYIFIRGWQALPPKPLFRILYTTVFSFFFISSIVSWFLFGLTDSPLVRIIHWAEAFWYGMMVYFFLAIVIIDLIRFISFLLKYRLSSVKHYEIIKQIIFVSIILLNVTAMYIGHKNASKLHITPITIEINKDAGNMKNLNIVTVSDFHLGSIITVERLKEIIRTVNSLKPDIVLIPGDIVDNNIEPLIRQNLGSVLSKIQSKYGVFASTGNHEFYGEDVDRTVKYLGDHGVTFLRDEAVKIGNSFYVIGREDKTGESYYDRKRKPLKDIISHVDKTYPLILMDHRPSNLNDALVNGIDLQVSGHSHHGQIFPLNLITEMVYEVSWGYLKKGSTHYYVSCGVGSWGPPARIGSISEIVNIRITFD
jgi:predicted MPP superfamily phosphohydrolase